MCRNQLGLRNVATKKKMLNKMRKFCTSFIEYGKILEPFVSFYVSTTISSWKEVLSFHQNLNNRRTWLIKSKYFPSFWQTKPGSFIAQNRGS